jgi:hypothetical protein
MNDLVVLIDILSTKIVKFMLFIIAAKFVTKRVGIKSLDRLLMKIHKPAGYILVMAGLIHMVFSFRLIITTPIIVYVLGFISFLAIIASIMTYVLRKKLGKHWLMWHRIMTLIAIITVILHPMLR